VNWTSEPPTIPGYYWWKACVNTEPMFILLGYARNETKLSVLYPYPQTTAPAYPYLMGGLWASPRKGNADDMDK